MRSRLLLLLALGFVVAACADDKAPALEPTLGDGKADVGEHVTMRGPLPIGGEVRGELREDLQFDGYELEVRPGALVTLDVTHTGSSSTLDTTLYVYGPQRKGDGGYGTDSIYFDDDSGWGRLSRITQRGLYEGGRYLIVVGSHDGRGRGRYRLTQKCSGDCSPIPGWIGDCMDDRILADMRNCTYDVLGDFDNTATPLEAAEMCGDPEAVADVYDAICAAPTEFPPVICEYYTFEEFCPEFLPACIRQLQNEILGGCLFGSTYGEIWTREGIRIDRAAKITSVAGLDALTRAQIVLAVQASSHTDVTTAEEALGRVDGQEINRLEISDVDNGGAFTAYEYGVGDNSYGRIFAAGTTQTVSLIHDGDLLECTVTHGPVGMVCQVDSHCAWGQGLHCANISPVTRRGRCEK